MRIETKLKDITPYLIEAYFFVRYSIMDDPQVDPETKVRLQLELEEAKRTWGKHKLRIKEWCNKRKRETEQYYSILLDVVEGREVDVWTGPVGDENVEAFIQGLKDEGIVE